MVSLHQALNQKLKTLKRSIKETKKERDLSPSAMESFSDQTRSVTERLLGRLEDEYQELLKLKRQLNRLPAFNHQANLNTLVALSTPSGKQTYLLVPEGLGGTRVGEITFLAVTTPLAQAFLNQSSGFKFSLNNNSYTILSLKPNI